jgi:hypothetical protein
MDRLGQTILGKTTPNDETGAQIIKLNRPKLIGRLADPVKRRCVEKPNDYLIIQNLGWLIDELMNGAQ